MTAALTATVLRNAALLVDGGEDVTASIWAAMDREGCHNALVFADVIQAAGNAGLAKHDQPEERADVLRQAADNVEAVVDVCPTCGGDGEVWFDVEHPSGRTLETSRPCPTC